MNRRAAFVGLVMVPAAAAWWWWPSDRRRIIAASRELAAAVSVPAVEPDLARLTRAARLSRLLARDFRLVDSNARVVVDGRDAAIGFATRLQPPRGVQVSVGELDDLTIGGDGLTARARTVVTMREPGEGGAADSVEARPVVLDWVNGETWALSAMTIEGAQ